LGQLILLEWADLPLRYGWLEVDALVVMPDHRQGLWLAGERLWQRGYHDRIVRSESGLRAARGYIAANPRRWERSRGGRRGG
jgi:hypothetical protein